MNKSQAVGLLQVLTFLIVCGFLYDGLREKPRRPVILNVGRKDGAMSRSEERHEQRSHLH